MKKDKRQKESVILTVDALITDAYRILVMKRAKPPFQDKWVLPGGHVALTDASVVAACQREVREETELTIALDRFNFHTILDSPERDPRPRRRVSVVYVARLEPDELEMAKAGDGVAELQLLTISEKVHHRMFGFDHWKAIAMYDYCKMQERLEDP